MSIARSVLFLMTGAASGIAFMFSCGDGSSVDANVDANVDASADASADAPSSCECPAAEPPLAGRVVVVDYTITIPANDFTGQGLRCPLGTRAMTGSCTTDNPTALLNVVLKESGFWDDPPSGWGCEYRNNEPFPVTFRLSVLCLKPTS